MPIAMITKKEEKRKRGNNQTVDYSTAKKGLGFKEIKFFILNIITHWEHKSKSVTLCTTILLSPLFSSRPPRIKRGREIRVEKEAD